VAKVILLWLYDQAG